jgi:hypothetical protein
MKNDVIYKFDSFIEIKVVSLVIIIITIIYVMQLSHLLTRSSFTCPETSSKVCHDSFCQSDSSVSLPWVIYYESFCLHVVSSNLSKIGVIFNSFPICVFVLYL